MTIQAGDIKFLQSDTMTDADEGGGAVTSNVIIDGQSNNILEDVSTLDRVHGAVKLRKIYGAVITQTNDKYFGTHIIISKLPADQQIGINLFNTGDWFDRRQVAQSRIENYLAQGGVYNGFLWQTQYQGSRAVIIFQSPGAPVPGIGDVLVLKDPINEQYIRITRIDNQVQPFVDGDGSYSRRILTLEISDSLEHDFIGTVMSRKDSTEPEAGIFNTVVANAARYYSSRPLAVVANTGDLAVKVDSVYSQVVPSAQSETPLIDETAGGASIPIVESSTADVSFIDLTSFAANSNLHLGGGAVPGSVSIAVTGDTLVDVAGQIKNAAGTVVGTITYSDGLISFGSTSPTYSGSKTVTFRPAAAPQRLADTILLYVTAANRGYVWTININPAPLPTSVRVAYRALNKWYELFDNGGGGLSATNAAIGSGTINYVTGSITVTFGALPDADSEILFAWSNKSQYANRSNLSPPPLTIVHQLLNESIQADSLVISWNDGQARSATTDVSGNIAGDASGQLQQTTGEVKLIPNTIPLKGSVFRFNYSYGDLLSFAITGFANTDTTVTLDTGHTNVVPGSVSIAWQVAYSLSGSSVQRFVVKPNGTAGEIIKDDGQGNLISVISGINVGTFDYASGIATFNGSIAVEYDYFEPVAETYEVVAPNTIPRVQGA